MQDINENNVLDEPIEGNEPQPKAAKMTPFDATQQARFTEAIKKAKSEAAKDLRAENAQLQRDLADFQRRVAPPEDLSAELGTAKAELASLRAEKQETVVRDSLRAAVGRDFIDPDLAVQILRASVIVVNGKPVVVDADGCERLGADLNPLTVADAARELAAAKPFLARGTVISGSGSKPADRPLSGTGPKLEQIFGKHSDSGLANRIAMHDPLKYKQLKRQAIEAGLL